MPLKPMLSVEDLIVHSKEKGISFNICSENDAIRYLGENNNYFKLSSYRKNFTKVTTGIQSGKYEFLDFAYLIELARIDVEVRHIILKMCLDIEHFLKVILISAVESNMQLGSGENGYRIITDFLSDAGTDDFGMRANNISRRAGAISRKVTLESKNPYCAGLIAKYHSEMPIWAFVEIISFGDLKNLVEYYSSATGWQVPVDLKSLDRVRQIRNAAAHNNCIINDLTASKCKISTPRFISEFVSRSGISRDMRDKKLSNPRINQIVHLLFVYDKLVTSKNTRQTRLNELNYLIDDRIVRHEDYFEKNALLTSTYKFFAKLIKGMG